VVTIRALETAAEAQLSSTRKQKRPCLAAVHRVKPWAQRAECSGGWLACRVDKRRDRAGAGEGLVEAVGNR
jgi:hypothetical protein